MKYFAVCVLAIVGLSLVAANAVPRGPQDCPAGTRYYSIGCGFVTREATCRQSRPRPDNQQSSPTVRNEASGQCVHLDKCPGAKIIHTHGRGGVPKIQRRPVPRKAQIPLPPTPQKAPDPVVPVPAYNSGYTNYNSGYNKANTGYNNYNTGYANNNKGNAGYIKYNSGYMNTNNGYKNYKTGYKNYNNGYANNNKENAGYTNYNSGYANTNNGYENENTWLQ